MQSIIGFVGLPLEFIFSYTLSGVGVAGAAPTAHIYRNGTRIPPVSPATSWSVTQISSTYALGAYKCTLPAEYVTEKGSYACYATVGGSCDLYDQVCVAAVFGRDADDALLESLTYDATVSSLLTHLKIRLNDYSSQGNYTNGELLAALNMAYAETCMRTGAYVTRVEHTLVSGTHTYDGVEIYDTAELYFIKTGTGADTIHLTRRRVGDVGVTLYAWDQAAAADPAYYMQLAGNSIRIHPTPGASQAGMKMIQYGRTKPAQLSTGTDVLSSLPEGVGIAAVLDLAEYHCRKARSAYAENPAILGVLYQSWINWCSAIDTVLRGSK